MVVTPREIAYMSPWLEEVSTTAFTASHGLKITQIVAYELFNFGIFHQFFVLVTLLDRKFQVFKNSPN